MCLIVNTNIHKKNKSGYVKALTAQEDIFVYKCLDHSEGEVCTPFQYMPITFKDGKFSYDTDYMVSRKYCYSVAGAIINEGIHSYWSDDYACNCVMTFHEGCGTKKHYAVIPKGSKFFVGTDGDVVSDNLIVYRSRAMFRINRKGAMKMKDYIKEYQNGAEKYL
jgi:hypothetical protein